MHDIIYCAICAKGCRGQIPGIHLKKHGITVAQYEGIYGPSRTQSLIDKCAAGAKLGGGSQAAKNALKAISEAKKIAYNASPKKCKECSGDISYEQDYRNMFCSRSCRTANTNRAKNLSKKYTCLMCAKHLPRKGKFCNQTCQYEHKRQEWFELWVSGEREGGTEIGFSKSLRSVLLREAGNKCSQCGWGEQHSRTGLYPLHVDHINGDCTDHRYVNLRVLCPNCHSLTDNYGALNRNNKGRTVRRRERKS